MAIGTTSLRVAAVAAMLVGGGLLAACSSTATTASSKSAAITSACVVPSGWKSVVGTKEPGGASEYDVTSFDGTKIRVHWFPLSRSVGHAVTAPTVFMGPGWGETGSTDTTSRGLFGALDIASLWKAGYNVLTWDPRGFGKSGGAAQVDLASVEGRDVTRLISWVAQQKGVELDGPGNPRMGMVGASYGGGIQFATAAQDCRVDAIAPMIAWHSLTTSLYKNQTVKAGWSNILTQASAGASLNPNITHASATEQSEGIITKAQAAFFASRGPGALVAKVHQPTLILQGTVDDLFTLQEGVWNYEELKKAGTTVSMVWFCGGHGSCLTDPGTVIDEGKMSIEWMNRYVKDEPSAKALRGFEMVDQAGTTYSAPSYPPVAGSPVSATGSGTLELTSQGGSGPATASPTRSGASAIDAVALGVAPAKASNAIDVTIPFAAKAVVAGPPRLTMTYAGSAPPGTRPTRVFAQLVDPTTGLVLGNQITPIPVILDGSPHTISLPLEIVAFTAAMGSKLELQITPTTVAYSVPRLGGALTMTSIHISLPTATNLSVVNG